MGAPAGSAGRIRRPGFVVRGPRAAVKGRAWIPLARLRLRMEMAGESVCAAGIWPPAGLPARGSRATGRAGLLLAVRLMAGRAWQGRRAGARKLRPVLLARIAAAGRAGTAREDGPGSPPQTFSGRAGGPARARSYPSVQPVPGRPADRGGGRPGQEPEDGRVRVLCWRAACLAATVPSD
jgi:hypothetical protein